MVGAGEGRNIPITRTKNVLVKQLSQVIPEVPLG